MNIRPLALLLLVPLLPLAGCNSQTDTGTATSAPRKVLTTQAQTVNGQQSLYTGVIAARTVSDLGFRVSGKVIERKVDPGKQVRRGDVLLVLDDVDFELALRSARNRVSAAEAELRQASADESRYRRLGSTGAVSRQVYEQSATRLRIARAEQAAATADAAQVDNRRAYSTLRADVDGVITEVRVDRGQVVAAGQIVAGLAHDGVREAVIDIPETQRDLADSPAQAHLYGNPGAGLSATLRELSAIADTQTRTFRARYSLAGNASALPLGATVTLRLDGKQQAAQLRVPLGALHDKGNGTGVWVIAADNKVTLRQVEVVRLGQEDAIIQGALNDSEPLVALGAHLLNEGDSVQPLTQLGLTQEQ